ncbi:hypothetical protein L1887_28829 [Cichorium endivia]|nr:hypothetical protein L1887_28829 [Cichorium endivia]
MGNWCRSFPVLSSFFMETHCLPRCHNHRHSCCLCSTSLRRLFSWMASRIILEQGTQMGSPRRSECLQTMRVLAPITKQAMQWTGPREIEGSKRSRVPWPGGTAPMADAIWCGVTIIQATNVVAWNGDDNGGLDLVQL